MGTAFKLGGMRAGSGSKVRIASEPKIEAVKSDVYVAPDGWKIFITSYSYEVSWPKIYAKWTLLITCKNLQCTGVPSDRLSTFRYYDSQTQMLSILIWQSSS